jgi:hypothetical protein
MSTFIKSWEYKQLITFLKQEKLYGAWLRLKLKDPFILNIILKKILRNEYDFSDSIIYMHTETLGWPTKNFLIISQLWRFFLLEKYNGSEDQNLEKLFSETAVKRFLIRSIKANGDRSNKKLKELFKTHKKELIDE